MESDESASQGLDEISIQDEFASEISKLKHEVQQAEQTLANARKRLLDQQKLVEQARKRVTTERRAKEAGESPPLPPVSSQSSQSSRSTASFMPEENPSPPRVSAADQRSQPVSWIGIHPPSIPDESPYAPVDTPPVPTAAAATFSFVSAASPPSPPQQRFNNDDADMAHPDITPIPETPPPPSLSLPLDASQPFSQQHSDSETRAMVDDMFDAMKEGDSPIKYGARY